MTDVTWYRDLLRSLVSGRPWVVAMDVLVPAAARAEALLELGADRALAIGAARGAGPLPDPELVPQVLLDVGADDMMESIRVAERALDDLPLDVRARVDAFDPRREARVLRTLFSTGAPVADRQVWGARPAAWRALEDKVVIDAVWDAAGVPRAPSEVHPLDPSALAMASGRLDRGGGTVWAGDASGGFNGGASYVRWIRSEGDAAEALDFFRGRCAQARVMPFLEGVPCSIHGIVFPDTTIALRPCEMVVFRVPGSSRFAYARAATFWDPPSSDRDTMRALARRVGDHLRATVGYRGSFTVDGVMTEDGFLPTELNPRFGAALGVLASALPELPLYLLHTAIAAGEALDYRPHDLERLLVESADENRVGGGGRLVHVAITEPREGRVVDGSEGWRLAEDGEPCDATATLGAHPVGGYLRVTLEPDRTPVGPSCAPRVAEVMRFLDTAWGLGIGPIEAAPEVR